MEVVGRWSKVVVGREAAEVEREQEINRRCVGEQKVRSVGMGKSPERLR